MLKFISEILLSFYSCFTRSVAFDWFVVIIVGFMVRSDSLGITSIIRDLALNPNLYTCLEHFFRASSWQWDSIFYTWVKTAASKAPLRRIAGRAVLIGDETKRAADGKYMPCVKKMVQESESASKPTFIHGHFFGAVGVLIGNTAKSFCLPLSIQIHDGDRAVSEWAGDETVSHVVQMLRDGGAVRIQELFAAETSSFQESSLPMYGTKKQIRYLSRVYLWGKELYLPLLFVLVEDGGKQVILASTDLTLSAEDVIISYAFRAKIETMFKEFKQQFGGLCYHFWTKAVP